MPTVKQTAQMQLGKVVIRIADDLQPGTCGRSVAIPRGDACRHSATCDGRTSRPPKDDSARMRGNRVDAFPASSPPSAKVVGKHRRNRWIVRRKAFRSIDITHVLAGPFAAYSDRADGRGRDQGRGPE